MTEDTATALGVRSRLGFGEVPQRARRQSCPFLLDRRIAALSAGVRPSRTGLRVAARTTHPRPRAACWLALLLIRVSERRTGQTWPTRPVAQTTELTTAQQGILRAWGLTRPPRITALHPA